MLKHPVTVCVLLYGDHLQLATRCVDSIRNTAWHDRVNIVIGMNAVCESTRQYIYGLYGTLPTATIFDSDKNICKYPMMRHMFYDSECGALNSEFVMWFDDDSYVLPGGPATTKLWLSFIQSDLHTRGDMVGSKYTIKWQGQQRQWVQQQPWFNKSVKVNTSRIEFITGGWWAAKSAVLRSCDYPWKQLHHNGGDSMLGEMFRHVGYTQLAYTMGGIAVNADASGVSGRATRRGVSEPEIGRFDAAGTMCMATTPDSGNIMTSITENGLFV